MANNFVEQVVKQILQEKTQAGEMFTAFDVTQEARKRSVKARHNTIRDVVHACHQGGELGAAYNRTSINLTNGQTAFLYHRFDADPYSYPNAVRPSAPVFKPKAPKPTGGGSSSPSGPKKLNLDADDFLPISRDELVGAAKKLRSWGVWFGRRDLIPPGDDERTKLIDRALVTNGLLTPEQLAEMHQVGDEMMRLRPELEGIKHLATKAGEEAVKEERERRAKLKEQKKAEAAERKKKRADEVAHRRATDIIFLGRGVSGRLHDRQSDVAKLTAAGLPVLSTPADIANVLGVTIPQLRWLAFHTEVASRVHYVSFEVPKKSGGTRRLSAPHRKLAKAQEWILENVVNKLPVEPPAHGFIGGRSILTNAKLHTGRQVIVNMDLEGFFPSIAFPRIRSVFQRLGYSPAVATIFALLCTECPRKPVEYDGKLYHVATGPRGLPQGACTSPGLSNQVARKLDKRLGGLAKKMGLTYTRYADDVTFSGDQPLSERIGYLMARFRHLAQEEGFAVNEKKSRVLRRSTAQVVTGLVVNDRPGVSRDEVRRLRAILHRARTEGLDKQNRENRPNFRAWLLGKISYVSMARPGVGSRLRKEYEALIGKEPGGLVV